MYRGEPQSSVRGSLHRRDGEEEKEEGGDGEEEEELLPPPPPSPAPLQLLPPPSLSGSTSAARPKSIALSAAPGSEDASSRFSGLRSRWTTPRPWQCATTRTSSRTSCAAQASV